MRSDLTPGPTRMRLSAYFAGWRRWWTTPLVVGACGIAVVLATTTPLGCFSLKEPPCAFSCATPPHACPANYTCGADDLCHRTGATALCPLISPDDAGLDAIDVADGGTDDTGGPDGTD